MNAAPFRSYNYVATSPPMLAINIAKRAGDGAMKDTAANILARREFVVNVATEATIPVVQIEVEDGRRGESCSSRG